ncbi:(ZYRO0D08316g) [Zygosaccharomyces parabailii]|nr:(ZYRO0D08316g) [Zygosaccharomyces parabailii]
MPPSDDISASYYGSGVHKPRKKEFKGKRAVRACDTCRRLKTRCILSPIPNEFYCLRCESLKIPCSFQEMLGKPDSRDDELEVTDPETLKVLIKHGYGTKDAEITSKLLHSINNNVVKVLEILEVPAHRKPPPTVPSVSLSKELLDEATTKVPTPRPRVPESPSSDLMSSLQSTERRHIFPYLTSPFVLFSQMVSKGNLPLPVRKLYDNFEKPSAIDDLISLNLITFQEALLLVEAFREHYGAWCSFPASMPIEMLVDNIRNRNGSLLLTATCVLALRYTDRYHDLKTRVYKNLLFKLKSDLELSLKIMPQNIEFLQAIVILSLYASSFSSDIMSLDGWYLSGIGIQQYLTINIQESLQTALGHSSLLDDDEEETQAFTSYRIWNHLCLVHLTHCVFSGRMCAVDEIRLDLSRRVLQLPKATNFDGRMVGEIALELILYNFMQRCQAVGSTTSGDPANSLEDVKEDLKDWVEEWNYLFTQPITQFLEFAYHYGYAMIIYTWYHRLYRLVTEEMGTHNVKIDFPDPDDKTQIGTCLNQLYPLEKIIGSMPPESRLEMLLHNHEALKGMVGTDFEIFKHLSDQIFFCSVLASLMCIEIASSLQTGAKDMLHEDEVREILMDVKLFSLRLQKIREGELKSFWVEEVDLKVPSVILQYHTAIENCLQTKFPKYEHSPV